MNNGTIQREFACNEFYETEDKLILIMCANYCTKLCDGQVFNFKIYQCIAENCNYPKEVFIKVKDTEFPLVDKFADKVFSNQLRAGVYYRGRYGAICPHVIVYNDNLRA